MGVGVSPLASLGVGWMQCSPWVCVSGLRSRVVGCKLTTFRGHVWLARGCISKRSNSEAGRQGPGARHHSTGWQSHHDDGACRSRRARDALTAQRTSSPSRLPQSSYGLQSAGGLVARQGNFRSHRRGACPSERGSGTQAHGEIGGGVKIMSDGTVASPWMQTGHRTRTSGARYKTLP